MGSSAENWIKTCCGRAGVTVASVPPDVVAVAPYIPKRSLSEAIDSYAPFARPEDICLVFGTRGEGFCLTRDYQFLGRSSWSQKRVALPLCEFPEIEASRPNRQGDERRSSKEEYSFSFKVKDSRFTVTATPEIACWIEQVLAAAVAWSCERASIRSNTPPVVERSGRTILARPSLSWSRRMPKSTVGLPQGIYVAPWIPMNLFEEAVDSFAPGLEYDDMIVLFHHANLLRSSKTGLCISRDGIVWWRRGEGLRGTGERCVGVMSGWKVARQHGDGEKTTRAELVSSKGQIMVDGEQGAIDWLLMLCSGVTGQDEFHALQVLQVLQPIVTVPEDAGLPPARGASGCMSCSVLIFIVAMTSGLFSAAAALTFLSLA